MPLFFLSLIAFGRSNKERNADSLLVHNIDFALGYAPQSPYHALKGDVSVNNLFLKRFGAYSSFEKGVDSEYYSLIFGLTTYVHQNIYLWYGLGAFTHFDTKNTNDWRSFRKEIGIGINPYKNMLVRAGWSKTVGLTVSIGMRVPIKSKSK